MSMVSFSPYQAVMVGGWADRTGGHRLRNYWTWDQETRKFEDMYRCVPVSWY